MNMEQIIEAFGKNSLLDHKGRRILDIDIKKSNILNLFCLIDGVGRYTYVATTSLKI